MNHQNGSGRPKPDDRVRAQRGLGDTPEGGKRYSIRYSSALRAATN
jgi:hypothetical protein